MVKRICTLLLLALASPTFAVDPCGLRSADDGLEVEMPGLGCEPDGYELVVVDAGCVIVETTPTCQAMLLTADGTCVSGLTCDPRPGPGVCVAGMCVIDDIGYIKQAIPYHVSDPAPGETVFVVWMP